MKHNEPRPINTRSKYLHTFDSPLFNQPYNTQINFGTFPPEKKKVNVDMEINNVTDLLKMLILLLCQKHLEQM